VTPLPPSIATFEGRRNLIAKARCKVDIFAELMEGALSSGQPSALKRSKATRRAHLAIWPAITPGITIAMFEGGISVNRTQRSGR